MSDITPQDKKGHTRKRRRCKRENPYPDIPVERTYLAEVPIEVLSNILQYVYPIDLLALSRTNGHFHKTLADIQQRHIWKSARKRFSPVPIPDPVVLTEMAVASRLFDTGLCSICNTGRDALLSSFLQPMRVCDTPQCRETFKQLWEVPPPEQEVLVYGILPSEKPLFQKPSTPVSGHLWRDRTPMYCKKIDVASVLEDIKAGLGKDELEVKYKTTFEQTKRYSGFLECLRRNSERLRELDEHNESQIQRYVRNKLSPFKFEGVHLKNSATYINERRRLRRSYQEITDAVWNSPVPRAATDNPNRPSQTVGESIIHEMKSMYEAAQRRQSEANVRKAREVVKEHWHQLKNVSGPTGSIVPRLNEFHALPVVNALLKPKASDGNVEDLKEKDSMLNKLVNSNVSTWEDRTCAQFRKILKIPIPRRNQAPELGVVPSLDRVTSLFECTQCKSVGLGLAQEGTLTFRSAVKHRCARAPPKKFQWKPDLFQPDAVGIQIAKQALVSSGRTEDKAKREDMDALGSCFLCKKCTSPIYLTFGNLIGHMKRHGVTESVPEGTFEYQATPPDFDPKMSSSDGMVEARRRGTKKGYNSAPDSQDFFVCRHCSKPFLWNALVSHVKAKHHFPDIRDEDFYPKPEPEPKSDDID